MVEITQEQIDRVNLLLSGISGGADKAFVNVINRALVTLRAKSSQYIRETYHIRARDLKANSKLAVKNATVTDVEGTVTFAGTVIPLIKFKVDPARPERKQVTVSVMRQNGGKRLEAAYVANLGRYGDGVFERLTSRRESSQQMYGPSVAHMAANYDVIQRAEAAAQETVDKRVEHEITRILNNYGGKRR